MMMMMHRVMCLLAVVFCCVGLAHAASGGTSPLFKEAQEKFKETLRLKKECEKVATSTEDAAHKAQRFAHDTEINLVTIAADPKEVEKRKSEGRKFIDNTTQAAAEARKVADKTTESAEETFGKATHGLLPGNAEAALKAVEDADKAVRAANTAIENAELHAKRVEEVINQLDAAVAAAKKKEEEKQLESQQHPQTKETSLGEQQGHTEGNKTEETHEKQKEKQKQHYRSTFTINIHGDNLDALLNGAANNSGMA
ncbi:uncharacterized protein TM35_001231030, partial [Trypanosoma theileri]